MVEKIPRGRVNSYKIIAEKLAQLNDKNLNI
jgi:O6-methylguanine-DNA--protein-cysteine methyltransferase